MIWPIIWLPTAHSPICFRLPDASEGCAWTKANLGLMGGKRGAGEGTRTPDPIITNDVLYQLSYSGDWQGWGA